MEEQERGVRLGRAGRCATWHDWLMSFSPPPVCSCREIVPATLRKAWFSFQASKGITAYLCQSQVCDRALKPPVHPLCIFTLWSWCHPVVWRTRAPFHPFITSLSLANGKDSSVGRKATLTTTPAGGQDDPCCLITHLSTVDGCASKWGVGLGFSHRFS